MYPRAIKGWPLCLSGVLHNLLLGYLYLHNPEVTTKWKKKLCKKFKFWAWARHKGPLNGVCHKCIKGRNPGHCLILEWAVLSQSVLLIYYKLGNEYNHNIVNQWNYLQSRAELSHEGHKGHKCSLNGHDPALGELYSRAVSNYIQRDIIYLLNNVLIFGTFKINRPKSPEESLTPS